MKIIATAVVLAVVVLVAFVYLLNRPQLNTIEADPPGDFPRDGFSHQVFERLLKQFVDSAGEVDYDAWHTSTNARHELDSYLAAVALFSPENASDRFATRNDALAYWLYAYNAYVIWGVLDRWPLDSVTDVKAPVEIVKGFGFFYRQRYLFGGAALSLYAVENQKIRATYKDARIHFVLNCGSESCPVLRPVLPTGDALETLLQSAAAEFVGSDKNVYVDHENKKVLLSEIFKWFEKDFISELRKRGLPVEGGLLSYITLVADDGRRTELARASDYEVAFAEYDWSVNDSSM